MTTRQGAAAVALALPLLLASRPLFRSEPASLSSCDALRVAVDAHERLRSAYFCEDVGVIEIERFASVGFEANGEGAVHPVRRVAREVLAFRVRDEGRTVRVRPGPLDASLETVLRYRERLAPWLTLIVREAAAWDLPPHVPFLTLGSEADYLDADEVGRLEEWLVRQPLVRHLRNTTVPINWLGGTRTLWDATLGLAQITPRTIDELVDKGYVARDFGRFCVARGLPAAGAADRFAACAAYAQSTAHAIRAHIAYLRLVADEAGLDRSERYGTRGMMQLLFAHYHSRPDTRFEAFERPRRLLRLAFEEYDVKHYPVHEPFRGYGALLAPASQTIMMAVSAALNVPLTVAVDPVVDVSVPDRALVASAEGSGP